MILPSVINAILSFIASFFVLCYPLSAILPRGATIALSAVSSIPIAAGAYFLTAGSERKKRALKIGKNAFNERMHALYTCTDDEIQSLFLKIFYDMRICAEVRGRHMLLSGDEIVFAALYPEPMSANEIALIVRKIGKKDNVTIISSSFSFGAVAFARSLDISLVDGETFHSFLSERGYLPETPSSPARKRSFKRFVEPLFERSNSKKLLFFAAVLGIFSAFSFFPIYYIFGSAFFAIYGLIALFFGKSTELRKSENPLEKLFGKDRAA